jgi:triphosphoribosyl-dephospho-CoA synthase
MSYEDFLRSAIAIGPVMGRAGSSSVGDTVLAAVETRRTWTTANTNLGIILLFAPLAKAAFVDRVDLRTKLEEVLANLTVHDARQTYQAIRLAAPGGMGDKVEHDIHDEPDVTLLEAMRSAGDRDKIAAEYCSNFATIFELALPKLLTILATKLPSRQMVVQLYLEVLAAVPDTLIARKRDMVTARHVSQQARQVLQAGGVYSERGRKAITRFDLNLRQAAKNSLNPGTTADLVAATLFAALLLGKFK